MRYFPAGLRLSIIPILPDRVQGFSEPDMGLIVLFRLAISVAILAGLGLGKFFAKIRTIAVDEMPNTDMI